jgi:NAD(P)-dependent dehydrogenase (short-subunit alcohol dehydrogenase family)
LITGGSGTLGLAIAKAFADLGTNVVLWGHYEIEGSLNKKNSLCQNVELTERDDINRSFRTTIDKFPNINILVNCAGFTIGGKSEDYLYENWEKTLSINLTAPFLLSQLVAKNMIISDISESIINITSIGAELGFPDNPAYIASKGGLKQLTKGFAYDWAKYGIRVNCVGPGYTKTKMTQNSYENENARQERTNHTLLKRWANPEDIVGMVLFLASDISSYITGQSFYVDGGWTIKGL